MAMLAALVLLAVCLVVALFYRSIRQFAHVREKQLPTAFPWPILGNVFALARFGERLECFIDSFVSQYGNIFLFHVFSVPVLYVGEAETARKVIGDTERFPKAQWEKHVLRFVMDKGLIILAGEDWKQHHRLLLPWFQTETCCRAARESTAIAQELFSSTVNAPDVDMHRQFRKLVLETMSRLMLDISLLEKGLLDSFTDDLDIINRELEARASDVLQVRAFFLRHRVQDAEYRMERMRQLVLGLVSAKAPAAPDALPTEDQALPNLSTYEPLISYLRRISPWDDVTVTNELRTLYAASETTTNHLSWAVYLLAQPENRSALEKAREEIATVLGDRPCEEADISKLRYVAAISDETLRLYPPAPAMFRQPLEEQRINDVTIPAGAVVVVSPLFLHRDARYFPEPLKFLPERWLQGTPPPLAFIPFGVGKRMCVGKRLSGAISTPALVYLIRNFDWDLHPGQNIRSVTQVLNRPSQPVRCSLTLQVAKSKVF